MDQNLKERLVGAAVLIILAVIFIPMFLSDVPITEDRITETNIPEKPEAFSSRIVPLEAKKSAVSSPETAAEQPEAVAETTQAAAPAVSPDEAAAGIATVPQKEVIKDSNGVGLTAWVVQLGSFSSEENAQSLNSKLRQHKYPAFVEPQVRGDSVIYRVRVGPELRRSNAEKLKTEISKKLGVDGILVQYP
ncbi:MAG: SPOR domain-containing protein [Thiotrichales bacterium]|nr:SPOR domain-containing protein [Thiotrichales bacterium]